MRKTLLALSAIVLFLAARPASAQLRSDVNKRQAKVELYGQGDPSGFSLNQFFKPEDFEMHHSLTMSSGSFGGGGYAYGMYTNTVLWQPNKKLAARVDVSYLQDFGGTLGMDSRMGSGGNQGKLFLRNAEIAYRPTKNTQLHLQIHQSPFGRYARPFGRAGYRPGPFSGYGR